MLEWRRVEGRSDEEEHSPTTGEPGWFTRPGPLYLPDGDAFQLIVKTTDGALVTTPHRVRDIHGRVLRRQGVAYIVAPQREEGPLLLRICLATGAVRAVWQFEWNNPHDLVLAWGRRLAATLDEGLSLYRDEAEGLVLERQWSVPGAWSLTPAVEGKVLIVETADGTWVIGLDGARAVVLSRLEVPMCIDIKSAVVHGDRVRIRGDYDVVEGRWPIYEADRLAAAHAAAFAPGALVLDELREVT